MQVKNIHENRGQKLKRFAYESISKYLQKYNQQFFLLSKALQTPADDIIRIIDQHTHSQTHPSMWDTFDVDDVASKDCVYPNPSVCMRVWVCMCLIVRIEQCGEENYFTCFHLVNLQYCITSACAPLWHSAHAGLNL